MKFICTLMIFGLLAILFANAAMADKQHHSVVIEKTPVTNNIYTDSQGIASAIAAGQHHYKATQHLQWSIGAGFAGDESALSFGLGLQAGKVFVSGNVTNNIFSGDSDPVIGIGASGTF